ncbi:1-acyl-sn-glycerol-3-phosphate acyltransferase [Pelistega sp. MC2]|uniref:lysophospholipid acyltransferase family protein n=1 Tax=Pelistega sp. MC2 TaxID=1720297 RepID=UPI0008DA24B0|nr:lysophospholipid acyltransferase family protein [Pelistega sp. MC2]
MSYLRFTIRVIGLLCVLILGLFIAFAIYAWLGKTQKEWVLSNWSKLLMSTTGVRITQEGQPIMGGPVMLTANHVSWIDIFIINSQRATSFIAKSEIRQWPVIGWLVAAVGTIFIQRGSRQAVIDINAGMADYFKENTCIGLFPEGTTSDGFTVLHMFSGLLEGAMNARVPIQPVALLFTYKGKRSGRVAFVGEQTLVANIWVLLSSKDVGVTVRFLPPITQAGEEVLIPRQELADKIRERLLQEVDVSMQTDTSNP